MIAGASSAPVNRKPSFGEEAGVTRRRVETRRTFKSSAREKLALPLASKRFPFPLRTNFSNRTWAFLTENLASV